MLINTYPRFPLFLLYHSLRPGPLGRSDAPPPGVQTIAGSILRSGETFFRRDLVMNLSTAILSLPLTQVVQLSVTSKRMCTTLMSKPAYEKWLG